MEGFGCITFVFLLHFQKWFVSINHQFRLQRLDHASPAVLGCQWNRLFMKTFACINWLYEADLTGEATL
jgi:hypothetical protein